MWHVLVRSIKNVRTSIFAIDLLLHIRKNLIGFFYNFRSFFYRVWVIDMYRCINTHKTLIPTGTYKIPCFNLIRKVRAKNKISYLHLIRKIRTKLLNLETRKVTINSQYNVHIIYSKNAKTGEIGLWNIVIVTRFTHREKKSSSILLTKCLLHQHRTFYLLMLHSKFR